MREILFRGKRQDNGKWIYGFLIMNKYTRRANGEVFYVTKPNIIPIGEIGEADYDGDGNYYEYEVIPETVGQYTGLTDKNGTKIFEGDIVTQPVRETRKCSPCLVEFRKGKFQAHYISENRFFDRYYDINSYTKIIGNIHDNPELLKGGER